MDKKIAKKIFGSWYGVLTPILNSEYFNNLINSLNKEYKTKEIFPKKTSVFRAFSESNYRDFRIIILDQDPYPNNKATGLSFANSRETSSLSPSLKRIRDVIEDDYYQGLNLNIDSDFDQTLESLANQGVLLLNTALTVEKGSAGSHLTYWETFIKMFFKIIREYNPGTIYVLWGKYAQNYKKYIDLNNNYIIEAEHPAASIYQNRKWNFSFKEIDNITYKLNKDKIKW